MVNIVILDENDDLLYTGDWSNGTNLMPLVPAGTGYRLFRDDDSLADFTVPALIAGSIVQSSPEVGDTLTVTGSNATGGATFQWQVDTGGGYGDVSGATSATLDTTGEAAGDYRRGVTDGVQGPVYTAGVTVAAADVTAPILSSPTGANNGATGATTLGVTTDEGNGTLYWGIYPTASTPSAADVVAGTGATVSGSQAVSTTGAQSVADQTGLTASTAYKVHYVHDDAAANRSNLATSSEFTTAAAAGGNPSLVGGAGGSTRVYSNTVTVPIHASSVEGQKGVVVFTHYSDDSGSGTVTLPSGWNQVGTRQVAHTTLSVDVYEGPLSAGMISAGNVSVSFSTTVDRHGLSLTVADAGAVSGFSGATGSGGGPQTMPSITVVEGAMTIGAIALRNSLNTITMTPTAVASSYPTGSPSQSIAATVVEDESAGSSSSITAAYSGGPYWAKVSLQVEPA